MAGHVAAMRALRRGEHPLGFDPFGEHAASDEEEDNDDDIEEAGELNSDDEALASQGVRSGATPLGALSPADGAAAVSTCTTSPFCFRFVPSGWLARRPVGA